MAKEEEKVMPAGAVASTLPEPPDMLMTVLTAL
jgi:hypothetical protein